MIGWLKRIGARMLIRKLDGLEPILAAKILEAQKRLGDIPATAFSKELVDELQTFLCKKAGIDPEDLGV